MISTVVSVTKTPIKGLHHTSTNSRIILKTPKMSGFQAPQKEQKDSFTSSPIFKIGFNVVLFIAGVALIQSPIAENLVPQLQ